MTAAIFFAFVQMKQSSTSQPVNWHNLFVHTTLVAFPCVGFINVIWGPDANHSGNVASQADVGYEK